MKATIFDIETSSIKNFRTLEGLEKIHCLVIREDDNVYTYTDKDIRKGLEHLRLADVIVGHNIVGFDIPAIQKLYPSWEPTGLVRDTVILSRFIFSDQKNNDFKKVGKEDFPKNLIGSHSLKAWGHRLGEYKGDYNGGFDEYSDEMLDYCIQDTKVTQSLWKAINSTKPSSDASILEHDFACVIKDQIDYGFAFNVEKAVELYGEWVEERSKLEESLTKTFPPTTEEMKTPAYWYVKTYNPKDGNHELQYNTKTEAKKAGFSESEIHRGPNKIKTIPFNPGSRQQIAKCLIEKYGWKPKVFTPSGQPQIDESILKAMPYAEAKILVDYLTVSKRIAQLAEGKEAWLKLEVNGRLHGSVNTNGTVTGRCTHSRPNISQVPAVTAKYGEECRSLFCVPQGKKLVGVDASGLELRCLAHYLATYDNGMYIDIILNGDIHTANQEAAGLKTRKQAKEFIYALIYGAAAPRLGAIVGGGAREGQVLIKRFLKKMPALGILKDSIENALDVRDYLIGLDGRLLPIRSRHSALNTLLQSAGAILMKQATNDSYKKINAIEGLNARQVAHIHDELQYEVVENRAEFVGKLIVDSIRNAGRPFGFRCPLDGEYKVGNNWAETH